MAEHSTSPEQEEVSEQSQDRLTGGTYEIIRGRLDRQAEELSARLQQLNTARKAVFGTVDTQLISNDRVTTDHNCLPADMIPVGTQFIFGYNVHIGLKNETVVADVFSTYDFIDHSFHTNSGSVIADSSFIHDFKELYKYYKHAVFKRFHRTTTHLYMVFQVGSSLTDIKTFKWAYTPDGLQYQGNRSDHEVTFPAQHEFEWRRGTRDMQRQGQYPHMSILDRVFVDTIGGTLELKVEDNTDTGRGVYSEPVDHADQKLDDADIQFADLGNIILLKVRPYQEERHRYVVFNEKLQEATRIDAIGETCVLLPEGHGIIFPNGYYLQTGDYKTFDRQIDGMQFMRRIASPNGEDFLFVFHEPDQGLYVLLSYNIIAQRVENPILCHGYALFPDGELTYFRAEDQPQKHHLVQIFQTPYVSGEVMPSEHTDTFLYKVGNKDLVRGMAESRELITLLHKDDTYANLYVDLVRKSTTLLDSYYWLTNAAAYQLHEPIQDIRTAANTAIEAFEGVSKQRQRAAQALAEFAETADKTLRDARNGSFDSILDFVGSLSDLRRLRGEAITLREQKYIDTTRLEALEEDIADQNDRLSQQTVDYLLTDDALVPYQKRQKELVKRIESIETVAQAEELLAETNRLADDLQMLIDILGNLEIEDATQTTAILESVSSEFAGINQLRNSIRQKRKSLFSSEAKAEFAAQIGLLEQSLSNYLSLADSPEKTEDFHTKLLVQLEEMESKFVEFDEFVVALAEKRTEITDAFEARKQQLLEARSKRADSLLQAGERLLQGIRNRVQQLESPEDIHAYFASDMMVAKLRDLATRLIDMGDVVKSDDLLGRLKTARQDALRQLSDQQDLYVDGKDVIRFGSNTFNVNTLNLELTVLERDAALYYHLTGTNYFERIRDERFATLQPVWQQQLISETPELYRGEYLAFLLHEKLVAGPIAELETFISATEDEQLQTVADFMAKRYKEGYVKGIHDHDAVIILRALLDLTTTIDLLKYPPEARALGLLWWQTFLFDSRKKAYERRIEGAREVYSVFNDSKHFADLLRDFETDIKAFHDTYQLFDPALIPDAARYLFDELVVHQAYVLSMEAAELYTAFQKHLHKQHAHLNYERSLEALSAEPADQFELNYNWLKAFNQSQEVPVSEGFLLEAAAVFSQASFKQRGLAQRHLELELKDLQGDHAIIVDNTYHLNYNLFFRKLRTYSDVGANAYRQFRTLKRTASEDKAEALKLQEFQPRVLSSFVRNQLLDEVYLPLMGDNLAKQMGTAGEGSRSDRQGMLLLISPPGYGKTTLMAYVANRLGLVFVKINGPALGHAITSVDPAEARNAAARQELEKLNLAFEMGDNVMIYLDDIQHCNAELLQKFIPLADGTRRIEGVWQGDAKTYDFRGKKLAVVMAGNPYTESGTRFTIPDMLASRADVYNLGDIIGDSKTAFARSYIENALTTNPITEPLAGRPRADIRAMIIAAETGNQDELQLETNYATDELQDTLSVLEKMVRVRDIVLKVNQLYIQSAAQQEEYRTEPAFKLQGSYRDMNKLVARIVPVMNEKELRTLVLSHYTNESQTLTADAEANLLRFRRLVDWNEPEHDRRWQEILSGFQKRQKLMGSDGSNPLSQILGEMMTFNAHLADIGKRLGGKG